MPEAQAVVAQRVALKRCGISRRSAGRSARQCIGVAGVVGVVVIRFVRFVDVVDVEGVHAMPSSRAFRRCLTSDLVLRGRVAPQLVKGLHRFLVVRHIGTAAAGTHHSGDSWAVQLVHRLARERGRERDHREELEPLLLLGLGRVPRLAEAVDLTFDLEDRALVDADVGQAQACPLSVLVQLGEAIGWFLAVLLDDSPGVDAVAVGLVIDARLDVRVHHMEADVCAQTTEALGAHAHHLGSAGCIASGGGKSVALGTTGIGAVEGLPKSCILVVLQLESCFEVGSEAFGEIATLLAIPGATDHVPARIIVVVVIGSARHDIKGTEVMRGAWLGSWECDLLLW